MNSINDAAIDVVVTNYKTYGDLKRFLDSLHEYEKVNVASLTIVDVCGEADIYTELPHNLIRTTENIGYNKACNLGGSFGSAEVIGFFNSDTEFINGDCISTINATMLSDPPVGVCGPLQTNSAGQVTAGGIVGAPAHHTMRGWKSSNWSEYQDTIEAVTISGSALFVRRSAWVEMTNNPPYRAMFPEATGAFMPALHYYGESFLCAHARSLGYKNMYVGSARMLHEWHKSSEMGGYGEQMMDADREMYRKACDAIGEAHE